jgi:tRNA threonylcarbamoyladenosine biosynthesis protein TsaB
MVSAFTLFQIPNSNSLISTQYLNTHYLNTFSHYLSGVSLILNIETAVQTSSVCLADDQRILGLKINPSQKDSASWLHVAIAELVSGCGKEFSDLKAVAVSAGPGSYTGLRVGMSAAKGLCYALRIPLITISTLQLMAAAALEEEADLICPMIDARRMEVFTAVYNRELKEVLRPANLILDDQSLKDLHPGLKVVFLGNGSAKFQSLNSHPASFFSTIEASAAHMTKLSFDKYFSVNFSDLAYAVPEYGKDFYSPSVK